VYRFTSGPVGSVPEPFEPFGETTMYAEDKNRKSAVKGREAIEPKYRSLNESHGSFELVLSPVLLALLGYLLDRQLGTGPWLTVVAAILGLVGATIKLVVQYKLKMAEHEADAPWKSVSKNSPTPGAVS
jgi:F0F1-type ATP synthase assembly protein I